MREKEDVFSTENQVAIYYSLKQFGIIDNLKEILKEHPKIIDDYHHNFVYIDKVKKNIHRLDLLLI